MLTSASFVNFFQLLLATVNTEGLVSPMGGWGEEERQEEERQLFLYLYKIFLKCFLVCPDNQTLTQ